MALKYTGDLCMCMYAMLHMNSINTLADCSYLSQFLIIRHSILGNAPMDRQLGKMLNANNKLCTVNK